MIGASLLAQADNISASTKFLQAFFDGLALGARYALVVLGFVIIYRATGIINFAQGGFVLVGGYLTYNAVQTWGLPFYPAILVSMALTAALGVLIQRSILQLVFRESVGAVALLLGWAVANYHGQGSWVSFLIGLVAGVVLYFLVRTVEFRRGGSKLNELPIFGAVMVTIGLLFVIEQVVPAVWGVDDLSLGDPWGLKAFRPIENLTIGHNKLWGIAFAGIALGLFVIVDRFTKVGVAMRAVHFDQEAAVAQGIPTALVYAVAWGLAGAVAALAGVIEASGASFNGSITYLAFLAFPAMILGGFDSPLGAVIGGLAIGVVQSMFLNYQPDWLGSGFDRVGIFIVMIIVLMVRPYGLFGTPEVRRV